MLCAADDGFSAIFSMNPGADAFYSAFEDINFSGLQLAGQIQVSCCVQLIVVSAPF